MLTIKFTSDDPDAARRALRALAGFSLWLIPDDGDAVWLEIQSVSGDGGVVCSDGKVYDLADITELEVP